MSKVKKGLKLDLWNIVMLLSFIVLIIFLLYPVVNVLKASFLSGKGNEVTLSNYALFFKKHYYFDSLWNSLFVCILSTIFATLLGVPMAYIVTRYNIPAKGLFYILIILSLLAPPFIGAYSWIVLLGRNGLFVKALENIGIHLPTIYGWHGIVLVFTLQFYPHIFLYVQGALNSIDASLEEAAESLGVSKFKRLMTVTFPLILPTISAGALIVFLSAFSDFGTPILIGEGFRVMPVLAYNEFINEMGGNSGVASTLSIIMIIAGMLISYVLVRRKSKASTVLDIIVMLPYVLPGTVFGIALIISFNKKPIILTGTWIILVISYIVRKLPYTVRSSASILYQIDKSVEEASINLGVPPMKTFWKITAPLMLSGVASGAVLSWVTTINELSSTIVLYAGATATITVAIYSEVNYSNFGTGAALASILSFVTIISLLIVNKLSKGKGINI